MTSRRPSLPERLTGKRALVGLLQMMPSPVLAEMAAMCGYDFIVLDCEHGLHSEMDILHTLAVLGSYSIAGVVRLRSHDTHLMGLCLDMGADGILVPRVSTAEEAKRLARAMKYPPAGTRAAGAMVYRSSHYGLDYPAYQAAARSGVFLAVIIESGQGVENAEEIMAVDGVDAVIIGPSDLTADLGCAGDFSQPIFCEAVKRIERAAFTHGKVFGMPPIPGYPLKALAAIGHRLLIIDGDMAMMREAMKAAVANAKVSLDNQPP